MQVKYNKVMTVQLTEKHHEIVSELRNTGYNISKIVRNFIENKYYEYCGNYENKYKFFDEIVTEKQSYFLGLIMADGWITDQSNGNGYGVGLSLKKEDDYIVKIFSEIFDTTTYTKKKLDFIQCECVIYNQDLYYSLLSKGVYPRKSGNENQNTIRFMDRKLINHFIRGYFDGDGSIRMYKQSRSDTTSASIELSGGYNFLFEMNIFLSKYANIKNTKIHKHNLTDKIFRLRYHSKQDIIKFYNFLYTEANIYINRKKKIFDDFIDKQSLV